MRIRNDCLQNFSDNSTVLASTASMLHHHHQTCKALHPLGRPGAPEEVATAIAFLASKVITDQSRFANFPKPNWIGFALSLAAIKATNMKTTAEQSVSYPILCRMHPSSLGRQSLWMVDAQLEFPMQLSTSVINQYIGNCQLALLTNKLVIVN